MKSRNPSSKRARIHIAAALASCCFSADAAIGQDRAGPAIVWQRWEQSLAAERLYANPYRDVTLRATFTGPGGRRFTGYGFWDGDRTFKVRTAFPAPGEWTWETSSSEPADRGLHGRRGRVTVTRYAGENPLYRHGFLRVGDNRRHVAHADGTPFLWIGDTPWAAFAAATQAEWEGYLDNRRQHGFTLVQVHCGSGFLRFEKDRAGNPPFLGSGAALQWNPAYWRQVEEKVRAANERGLVVFICAVRQPGASFPMKDFPGDDEVEVARFARSLVARLMDRFVVYSPVADDLWSPPADAAGRALREASSVHLISAHPRFFLEPAVVFHGKDYVDVVGVQPGEGWTHDPYKKEPKTPFSTPLAAQNAWEWPLHLYRLAPAKPIVNQEGSYDHPLEADGRVPLPPRKSAYWSFLSGAPGFTYGCFGIWNWGVPIRWYPAYDFATALDLPAVAQIKHLAEFFGGIAWATLEPRHELVPYQATDPMRRLAVAASPAGALLVAYLPDNDGITLNLAGFPESLRGRWFNPLSGEFRDAAGSAPQFGLRTFPKPSGWQDAVLLLERAP